MLEESIITLINKDLDGAASAEELTRLQKIYAENEEARRLADDLRALARGLAGVERAAPPATLRPAVMRSIVALPKNASHSWFSYLWNFLPVSGNRRPALVFAGGVALGLLIFVVGSKLIPPENLDEESLVGSLALPGSTFTPARVFEFKKDNVYASVQTATGTATAIGGGAGSGAGSEHAIVRIRLNVPPGTQAVLAYNHGAGFVETVDVAKAEHAEISLEQGRVAINGVSSGEVGILLKGREILAGATLLLSDDHGREWRIPLDGTTVR